MAVCLRPLWSSAWLSLARAQLNFGEPFLAQSSVLRVSCCEDIVGGSLSWPNREIAGDCNSNQ
jgi:hypothetical protein